MKVNGFREILMAFGLSADACGIVPFGTGHIHTTYRVYAHRNENEAWILQKINTAVFEQPESIMRNWQKAVEALKAAGEEGLLVQYKPTTAGNPLFYDRDGNCWRLMPFVENSIAHESFDTIGQIAAAATAFGRLGRMLSACSPAGFEETIPGFFDIRSRYMQYLNAIQTAEKYRLQQAEKLIIGLKEFSSIINQYDQLCSDNHIPMRIVHGDCKPSNVLFDRHSKQLKAIADPDTLMPGYFFYDLGDMVRSMACTSAEDEPDAGKVVFRKDFYKAITAAYLKGIGEILSQAELALIPYAGAYMLYMQALRFITDYLQNDVYYPVKYETHNLVRARNQILLLQEMVKTTV